MKKKNRLKKWGRTLLILTGVTFISLFTWANWNAPTITERLPTIEMSSFDLSQVQDAAAYSKVDAALKYKAGVTACSVNPESQMATVTFHPTETSKEDLLSEINGVTGTSVRFKHFDTKAGCPMKATSEFFGKLKQSLCVRN
jgi:hypothetical protein